jgi:hypothetical protein
VSLFDYSLPKSLLVAYSDVYLLSVFATTSLDLTLSAFSLNKKVTEMRVTMRTPNMRAKVIKVFVLLTSIHE